MNNFVKIATLTGEELDRMAEKINFRRELKPGGPTDILSGDEMESDKDLRERILNFYLSDPGGASPKFPRE